MQTYLTVCVGGGGGGDVSVLPAYSHIEEIESYTVEAFAVCVCG